MKGTKKGKRGFLFRWTRRLFLLGTVLLFLVIGAAADVVGNYNAGEFLRYFSVSGHVQSFMLGVVRLRDVIYYLTFIGFMLFLTNRVLESRRWRA